MSRIIIAILICFLVSIPEMKAQFTPQTAGTQDVQQDSIRQEDFGLFNESNKNTFRVLFSGRPGKAALYSLILPGGGQFYNKRYWKIPLVYAALGGVGYLLYDNNSIYQEYKQLYIDNLETPSASLYYNYYNRAKQNRELAIFAVIGVHLFNVFDAYIDRHLIDFDMDDDLSLQLRPYPDGQSPLGLSLVYYLDQ